MSVRLVGDWKKAGVYFKKLAAGLFPVAEARLYENGEIVLKELQRIIDSQDGNWSPLAEDTITRKGHDTIYVESGYLRDNLGIRRIKSTAKGSTIFIGASPWKTHPESGLRFSDLMIFQEYGTDKIPARPLIRPAWENVEKEIKNNWRETIREIMKTGGRI